MKARSSESSSASRKSRVKSTWLLVVLVLLLQVPTESKAAPMREFIMSCSYGVLAGTLVGAASLAFTDQPGDNLNRVARGASLGLYAGIALGLYVVYLVPPPGQQPQPNIYENPGYLPPAEDSRYRRRELPALTMYPTFSEKGVDGAMVNWRVMSFD